MHHCCCMDRITSYGSSHDRESMGLALKVNIIRRPDDQLEINISDGLTAWAPATRSSRFDRHRCTVKGRAPPPADPQSQLDTIAMKCAPTAPLLHPFFKNLS